MRPISELSFGVKFDLSTCYILKPFCDYIGPEIFIVLSLDISSKHAFWFYVQFNGIFLHWNS